MAKMYHVTVQEHERTWSQSPVVQHDIIAASMDVAVKRALSKKMRTASSVRIEANRSNHGEYDKVKFSYYQQGGKPTWYPRNAQGGSYRTPSHVRRSKAEEQMTQVCTGVLANCPEVFVVIAQCKGLKVAMERADNRPDNGTPRLHIVHPGVDICLKPIDEEGRCAERHWITNPGVRPAGTICGA